MEVLLNKHTTIDSPLLTKLAVDITKGKTVQLNFFKEDSCNTYISILEDLTGCNLTAFKMNFNYSHVCKTTLSITNHTKFYGLSIRKER